MLQYLIQHDQEQNAPGLERHATMRLRGHSTYGRRGPDLSHAVPTGSHMYTQFWHGLLINNTKNSCYILAF
jgi:hypothetical protein